MKNFRIFLLVLAASLMSFAGAAETKSSKSDRTKLVQKLVDNFYAQKLLQSPMPKHDECYPEGPSCVDVACELLGVFGCDDTAEIRQVHRACRGNWDGRCVSVLCDKLGVFGCDDMNEIEELAPACVGNYDTDCIESTCDRLGTFGCDDMDEAVEVARLCGGQG